MFSRVTGRSYIADACHAIGQVMPAAAKTAWRPDRLKSGYREPGISGASVAARIKFPPRRGPAATSPGSEVPSPRTDFIS